MEWLFILGFLGFLGWLIGLVTDSLNSSNKNSSHTSSSSHTLDTREDQTTSTRSDLNRISSLNKPKTSSRRRLNNILDPFDPYSDNGTLNRNCRSSSNIPTNSTVNYRPKKNVAANRSSIVFNSTSSSSIINKDIRLEDLTGIHDALTGTELNINLGIFQCNSCKVFYHKDSVDFLKETNEGKCVSCQSKTIVVINHGQKVTGKNNYDPNQITLKDYKYSVGKVVTFEGYVHKVLESRRGNDFAVMFEPTSWSKGFKLVFFRSNNSQAINRTFITQLAGKTIKVRGLMVNHERFGYEIIVKDKNMILSIK